MVLFCVCSFIVVIGSTEIRGVAPYEQQYYKVDVFKCRNDPTKQIPANRINDNYCDCSDGSDEPGTSACVKGIFYCVNKGYKGTTLFSSQVNDGICDCCDGSDEHEGKVKCVNDCNEKGTELRKQQEEEKARIEKGLELKKQWIADAEKTLNEKRSSIDGLKSEVEKLKKVVEDLEAEKRGFEEKERAEQDIINERKKEAERLAQEKLAQEAPATPETEAQEQEALKDLLQAEPLPPQDGESGEQQEVHQEEGENQEQYQEPRHHHEEAKPEEEETELLKTIREGKRKIEDELSQVRRDLSSAESNLKNTEDLLKMDFGKNGEFFALHEKCFDYKTREYTYTMCPFGETKQGHTSLGRFEKWDPEYSLMAFTNGQQCWGGPKRSARITFVCGAENELHDIQEPNKCEYAMKFNTPAACSATPLEFLEHTDGLPHF